MHKQDFQKLNLPKSPGVYIFKNKKGQKLYIGKAANLKERVRSYFVDPVKLQIERGPHIVQMVKEAETIEWIETQSAAEAVVLEANLIKKYEPPYNIKEKSNKSFNFVLITNEDFPRVLIVRGRDLKTKWKDGDIKYIFGPFVESTVLRKLLKIVREIFPFRDKCSVPDKNKNSKACFYAQLGLCPGVCAGNISKKEYAKTIKNIKEFFEGKKDNIIKTLEKEMYKKADEQKFEEAAKLRDKIFALQNIKELALIEEIYKNQEAGSNIELRRIEGYDIAHLQGSARVGAIVVFENGKENKKEYRLFNIKTEKEGDTDALEEVLIRRFKHAEWKKPELIVIDGGIAQKRTAEKVLKKYNLENEIEIVSVVKDEKHKPKRILGKKKIVELYKNTILKVNAEAHRFVLGAHKRKRIKEFLNN